MILAIDPGTTETALCYFDGTSPHDFGKVDNAHARAHLRDCTAKPKKVFIEMVASYGMPVGREVFETVLYIGRLCEVCEQRYIPWQLVYRKEVKLHLCGQTRAKDGNIRQALVDRFGAPGVKKAPGLTYGMSGDVWQAFALAVTAWDTLYNNPA